MQDGSQQTLEQLISEGQYLLDRYHAERIAVQSPEKGLSDSFQSEVARVVVRDAFKAAGFGSTARRLFMTSLKAGKKNQIHDLESRFQNLVGDWILKVSSFLGQVSTIASKNRQNSHTLQSRFSKVENAVRPDTKLKKGISILKQISLQGVVGNNALAIKKKSGFVTGPDGQFNSYQQILDIAEKAKGYLIVVDPYPGRATLVVLSKVPPNQPMKFLTYPPQRREERAEFEVLARKLMNDRPELRIKYTSERTLHDRFMITESEAWHLGHSIKDFGNKLSAITQMSAIERSQFEKSFDFLWTKANPI